MPLSSQYFFASDQDFRDVDMYTHLSSTILYGEGYLSKITKEDGLIIADAIMKSLIDRCYE